MRNREQKNIKEVLLSAGWYYSADADNAGEFMLRDAGGALIGTYYLPKGDFCFRKEFLDTVGMEMMINDDDEKFIELCAIIFGLTIVVSPIEFVPFSIVCDLVDIHTNKPYFKS